MRSRLVANVESKMCIPFNFYKLSLMVGYVKLVHSFSRYSEVGTTEMYVFGHDFQVIHLVI